MASPMSAAALLAALKAEGLTVVEVGDWRDHNRNHKGPWGPVHGVVLHHTVTKGSAATVDICRKGHADLPGPLCHGVITKDGRVHLVGYGRANHAGLGDPDVLRAVIDEKPLPVDNEANTDGNRHFYGFECENLGDNKDPWPAVQVEAMVRASAALLRAHGWNKDGAGSVSVIAHEEWQPGKVDPRGPGYPGHAAIRARVAERLKHPASWTSGTTQAPSKPTTTNPKPAEASMDLNSQIPLGDWVKKQWPDDKGLADGKIAVSTALGSGYAHARRSAENTDEILKQLTALRTEVAQLRAAITKGA
ncbi:N-acetylmuramoyl-L-alanine amidase [Streptomyces nigra]|uniref:N-acetylmuramoyl-L-alanine amidase n=1 Tax=Streptomyces nigra TaxID=1827580 RepID=UPI003699B217